MTSGSIRKAVQNKLLEIYPTLDEYGTKTLQNR